MKMGAAYEHAHFLMYLFVTGRRGDFAVHLRPPTSCPSSGAPPDAAGQRGTPPPPSGPKQPRLSPAGAVAAADRWKIRQQRGSADSRGRGRPAAPDDGHPPCKFPAGCGRTCRTGGVSRNPPHHGAVAPRATSTTANDNGAGGVTWTPMCRSILLLLVTGVPPAVGRRAAARRGNEGDGGARSPTPAQAFLADPHLLVGRCLRRHPLDETAARRASRPPTLSPRAASTGA